MAKTVNEAMTAIADSIRENAEKALGVNISGKLSLDEMPTAINETCKGVYNMSAVTTRDEDRGKVLRLANRLVDGEYERVVEIDSVVDSAISDFDGIKGAIKDYQVDVPSGTPTSEYGFLVRKACENAAGATLEESFNMGVNAGREEVYEEIQQPLDSAIEKIQQYAYGGEGEPGSSAASRVSYVDNNIPNVYNSGVDDGKVSVREEFDKTMSGIDLSLENTVSIVNGYIDSEEVPGTPWEKIEYLDENIPKVYESGFENGKSSGAEDDYLNVFWDKFQSYGSRESYRYAFYDNYPDEIFNPKYDFKCYGNCSNMFTYAKMTRIEKTLDFSGGNIQCGSVFANAYYLKHISKLIVRSDMTYNSWFARTDALEDIGIEGIVGNDIDFKDCKKLTKTSIENIVSCLSSTASGKTLTLNKEAVNTAFAIDVDDESTYPVGSEYYALRHSRENWNFIYD